MRDKTTQADLRKAKYDGVWKLEKDSAFYSKRYRDTENLKSPLMVLPSGTVVHVEKVYRRGRAALLCHIDQNGNVWWSWTHASEYENTRQSLDKPRSSARSEA